MMALYGDGQSEGMAEGVNGQPPIQDPSHAPPVVFPGSVHPRHVFGKRWSKKVDSKVMKALEKRYPPYRLPLDHFIDFLFELPPREILLLIPLPEADLCDRVYKYYQEISKDRPVPPSDLATQTYRKGVDGRPATAPHPRYLQLYPSPPSSAGGDQPMGSLTRERVLNSLKLRIKLQVNQIELQDSPNPPNDSSPEVVPDVPSPSTPPKRAEFPPTHRIKLTKREFVRAVWDRIVHNKGRFSARVLPVSGPRTDQPYGNLGLGLSD